MVFSWKIYVHDTSLDMSFLHIITTNFTHLIEAYLCNIFIVNKISPHKINGII